MVKVGGLLFSFVQQLLPRTYVIFFHHLSVIFSHPHAPETFVSSLPFFISLHSVSEASSPSSYCGLYSCLSTSLPIIQKASGLARFFICVNFTPIAAVIRPGCCCIDVMASYFPGSSSASYKTPSPGLISSSSFSSLLSLKQKAFKASAFEPEALKDKYPTNTGSKGSYKHKLSFFFFFRFVFCFLKFQDPTSTSSNTAYTLPAELQDNPASTDLQAQSFYPTNTA